MRPDPEVLVRDLHPGELDQAIAVIARGMRDNPLHVAVYGANPDRRLECHARLMHALLTGSSAQRPICAMLDGKLVGASGIAPPGTCQPGLIQRLRLLPVLIRLGPRTAVRVLRWAAAWSRRDPAEPHVHLGPLAVDVHLQGRGIGSHILTEHCRRLDAAGQIGYLETDKQINVDLYERFGYSVIGREAVLGVPCWYMSRGTGTAETP